MKNEGGFTLIELLVALAIIAIAISSTVMLVRVDPRQVLKTESERLSLLLELAQEESEIRSAQIGWVPLMNGYLFQELIETPGGVQWETVVSDRTFEQRSFDESIRWEKILVENRSLDFGDRVVLGSTGVVVLEMHLMTDSYRSSIRYTDGKTIHELTEIGLE